MELAGICAIANFFWGDAWWGSIYGAKEWTLIEDEGRFLFLTFLKPIINGKGHYYVEARTRDQRRTDIVVEYNGCQYIIETKIWRGEEYQSRGRIQLWDYMDSYEQNKGRHGYILETFHKHSGYTHPLK